MHPLLEKLLLRLVVCCGYTMLVAWVFTFIEHQDESPGNRMERMLSELRREIEAKDNMTDSEFDGFARRAAEAMNAGNEKDWTFINSFFFVSTAFTTVGYGTLTTKTRLGLGVTMITCLFGIPISMLALNTAGELIACCLRFLVIKIETDLLKRDEPKHVKKKTFLVVCALMVTLDMSAAASATHLEEWNFLEGLYAWFITFTTIGFGDYVPFKSLARNLDQGKASEDTWIVRFPVFGILFLLGLSLSSCLFNCIVDSFDEIRDFSNRFFNCCTQIMSATKLLLCGRCTRNDVTPEERNQDNGSPLENQVTDANL